MSRAPPIRFLILLVGGWTCLRVVLLVPWGAQPTVAAKTRPQPVAAAAAPRPWPITVEEEAPPPESPKAAVAESRPDWIGSEIRPVPEERAVRYVPLVERTARVSGLPALAARPAAAAASPFSAAPRPVVPSRWSASAWLLARDDGARSLAAGGTLGGAQTGLRILYRLNGDPARPLRIAVRIASPLRDRGGAEAAVGVEWRPLAGVPVNLLAERRQAIGRDARNAFALMLHGGVSERFGRFRLDAYGQAGVVGARSRDLFADAGARLGVPVGGFEVGAALSGGAQPGLARLDAGPQVTARLPIAGESLRLTAEWRFRIAGDARPGSGPALTLASDF
jgi:hypothetical protein